MYCLLSDMLPSMKAVPRLPYKPWVQHNCTIRRAIVWGFMVRKQPEFWRLIMAATLLNCTCSLDWSNGDLEHNKHKISLMHNSTGKLAPVSVKTTLLRAISLQCLVIAYTICATHINTKNNKHTLWSKNDSPIISWIIHSKVNQFNNFG